MPSIKIRRHRNPPVKKVDVNSDWLANRADPSFFPQPHSGEDWDRFGRATIEFFLASSSIIWSLFQRLLRVILGVIARIPLVRRIFRFLNEASNSMADQEFQGRGHSRGPDAHEIENPRPR